LCERWNEREKRADFRAGQICATLANVHRDSKARSTPYEAEDFFPRLRPPQPPTKPQTAEEMESALRSITTLCGGKIKEST
jgi:hypothetical protein